MWSDSLDLENSGELGGESNDRGTSVVRGSLFQDGEHCGEEVVNGGSERINSLSGVFGGVGVGPDNDDSGNWGAAIAAASLQTLLLSGKLGRLGVGLVDRLTVSGD